MSEPPPNAFIGRSETPTDAELGKALGRTKPLWDKIIADLAIEHGATVHEWKCYSPKAGWALRLMRGKRTIVWLSPLEGCFRVGFVLGDKAMREARESGLCAAALEALKSAPKYPEGTGVGLLIKRAKDLPTVRKLAAVKAAN